MRHASFVLLLAIVSLLPACQAQDTSQPSTNLPPIEVFFSPKGGCTEAVVKELDAAKSTVLVQAYSFTGTPIAKALLEAHKRGVKVEVILDKCQKTEKYSEADFLVNVGIPVQIDAKHAIAHNKIMVIDGADGHHGQLQLHQGRRGEQRREPAGHPLAGTGGEVRGQLEGPCRPFRSLRRAHGGLLPDAPGGARRAAAARRLP